MIYVDILDAVEQLENLEIIEARATAIKNDWELRVAREDGTDFILTADFIPSRINIEVTNGIVTKIFSIG